MKVKIAFALFVVAQVISLDLGDEVKNNLVQTVGSLKPGDISSSANEQFEFSQTEVTAGTRSTVENARVTLTFVNELDQNVQFFKIFDNDAAWTIYRGKDFGGNDVESIANWEQTLKDVKGLKAYIKKKGYSGVSTRWGHAFFKKVDHVITERELNDVDDVITWVFDPSKKDVERPLPESGWSFHKGKDLGGVGDVESIANWVDVL